MMERAADIERRWALEVFPKRDITLVRGRGAEVWDDEGRRYIDCVAGIGVASVGHANEAVADALAEQARTLVTCPGIFYNDARARLLEKLASIAPEGQAESKRRPLNGGIARPNGARRAFPFDRMFGP